MHLPSPFTASLPRIDDRSFNYSLSHSSIPSIQFIHTCNCSGSSMSVFVSSLPPDQQSRPAIERNFAFTTLPMYVCDRLHLFLPWTPSLAVFASCIPNRWDKDTTGGKGSRMLYKWQTHRRPVRSCALSYFNPPFRRSAPLRNTGLSLCRRPFEKARLLRQAPTVRCSLLPANPDHSNCSLLYTRLLTQRHSLSYRKSPIFSPIAV